jgi:hypothetical protein
MNTDALVDAELARINWSAIREADGPATAVPGAIRHLLAAKSADDVSRAYWKLENHVVLQGQLFEAAAFVVPVLMAALVREDRPIYVRRGLLELLFQILSGSPHPEEVARGLQTLTDMCRAEALKGLWLLYREILGDAHEGAEELINLLEGESARLASFERRRAASVNADMRPS